MIVDCRSDCSLLNCSFAVKKVIKSFRIRRRQATLLAAAYAQSAVECFLLICTFSNAKLFDGYILSVFLGKVKEV